MGAWGQDQDNGEAMTEAKKKIMFSVSERKKAEFKLQLQIDNLTQIKFFAAILDGYINKDENLCNYINYYKKQNSIQNGEQRKKIKSNAKKAESTKNAFALGDEEVENIFDILEKEHPEL